MYGNMVNQRYNVFNLNFLENDKGNFHNKLMMAATPFVLRSYSVFIDLLIRISPNCLFNFPV